MSVFDRMSKQHGDRMSAQAAMQEARGVARRLEQKERLRGVSALTARASLARRVGVTPATWRNLALGRLKRLDVWLRDRLQGLLVRELEAEIARLTHELEVARQSGVHPASQFFSEAESHLQKAKAILGRTG